MKFSPISIDEYVSKYIKNNPNENEADLRIRLNDALLDFEKGVKCACGNDIWVVGSASVGNSCFSCITGELYPNDDYEIDRVVAKINERKGRRHIDSIDPTQICGIFGDDGYEIKPELIPKPSLCLTCENELNAFEDYLCFLTRNDQRNEKEFKCHAYRAIKK